MGVATTLSRGGQDGSGETERVRAPTVELSNGGTRGIFLAGPVLQNSLIFSDFTPTQLATLRTLWRDCKGPSCRCCGASRGRRRQCQPLRRRRSKSASTATSDARLRLAVE